MSYYRKALPLLLAVLLLVAWPSQTSAAPLVERAAAEVASYAAVVLDWLGASLTRRAVASSEAGPMLDPNGLPIAIEATDPAVNSAPNPSSDGEAGPTLDPDG